MRVALCMLSCWLLGSAAVADTPRIAIIIDDIGYRKSQDQQALDLPREFALAVIPGSDHGYSIGAAAARQGREVLVHLPMAPVHSHSHTLGPVALRSDADRLSVIRALDTALQELPFATGLNNHMGSLLTQQREPMQWLMAALRCRKDLYFVDSYTTEHSVALDTAMDYSVPAVRRDVFLDHDTSEAAIAGEVARLIRLARRQGHALAIAHPHPQTLAALRALPQQLRERGVELVAPSALLGMSDPTLSVEGDQ